MSVAQEIALKEFLAGAPAALEKAQQGDVPSVARAREVPEQTITYIDTDGAQKSATMPATTITEYVCELPGHAVTQSSGDFTSDFRITVSEKTLDKLPGGDSDALKKVLLFSDFVATGERIPALVVPQELKDEAAKLLARAGLAHNQGRSTYDEGSYSVMDADGQDGGKLAVFVFGWETFKNIGTKLSQGNVRSTVQVTKQEETA